MLISPEYQAQQRLLHASRSDYGTVGAAYGPLVSEICNKLEIDHLLDYGCARCGLFRALKVNHRMKLQGYDPGIEEYASPPVPAQMVTCLDVLEHVEPDSIDDVLDDLQRLTELVGLFSVCTGPALKTLPDGRNAHILQRPPEWWLPKFMERFDLQTFQRTNENSFHVIVYAKPRAIESVQGEKLA